MKERLITLVSVYLLLMCPAKAGSVKDFFNVMRFGAKGDGKALDSRAINKAITAAVAAGGGTVYLPAGNYLSGSIRLQSNISLFIDQGATIIAAPVSEKNGYDEEEPGAATKFQDSGHSHWHNSLIWGENLHDISIIGNGLIWGKGLYKDYIPGKQTANKAIALLRCRNVNIRDVSILHGGWFAILATGVDNFTLDNVKMDTNRDGVDIDCCKNVRISNCYVNSPYDDGICLKSSFALDIARATENVSIINCQVSGYDEGTLLDGTYKRSDNPEYHRSPTGRIKFGTESNGGGFKNITISNCIFDYCRGLALETVDGALLEDVTISNITMRDIVNDPIFLRLGARMRGPQGVPIGALRRVIISNIIIYNSNAGSACTISGLPDHEVEDITLNNIRMYSQGGRSKDQPNRVIPENEAKYPEPGMFGSNPAYGLFVRHAKNIKISDVEFNFIKDDKRPALKFDDVKGLYIRNFTPQRSEGINAITLKDVTDFKIYQSAGIDDQQSKSITAKEIK
jgi:polygalacturonase